MSRQTHLGPPWSHTALIVLDERSPTLEIATAALFFLSLVGATIHVELLLFLAGA